jgi:hypothetical protein
MKYEKDIILENIKLLSLNDNKKTILKSRFLDLFIKYQNYSKFYLVFFDGGRLLVTIGSISVPAILSIEYNIVRQEIYWVVWGISLAVSIINAYITLFKFDKKYYSNIAILERLSCEFWQYVALCGRYSGNYTSSIPTHENQFTFFMNNIERYQIRNIEEIYITIDDNKRNNQQVQINEVVPSVSKQYLEEHINDLNKKEVETNIIIS